MDVGSRITGFLLVNQNDDFCDACLAREAGVALEDVVATVDRLRHGAAFLRDRWRCCRCGRPGLVTRALPNRVVGARSKRLNG
jgi:hypothetical protein